MGSAPAGTEPFEIQSLLSALLRRRDRPGRAGLDPAKTVKSGVSRQLLATGGAGGRSGSARVLAGSPGNGFVLAGGEVEGSTTRQIDTNSARCSGVRCGLTPSTAGSHSAAC